MFFQRDYTDFLKELNDLSWVTSRKPLAPYNEYIYKDGVLEVALPGYSKDEVEIEIDGLSLKISGTAEDKGMLKCSFEKSFSLPRSFNTKNVKASMENGILKIQFEEIKEGSKKIKIS